MSIRTVATVAALAAAALLSGVVELVHTTPALAGTPVGSVGQRPALKPAPPSWHLLNTGSTARFRGLSPVSRDVAWISASSGIVLRTLDGGQTWQSVGPVGVANLQFRDIYAVDAMTAVVLASGAADLSRVYVTHDGGASWTETLHNTQPSAFFDCFTFFDRQHGIVLSDPVDGRFQIASTSDGGTTWTWPAKTDMPATLPGEFAFAASGTCVATSPLSRTDAWIATGGGPTARVFHSTDRGTSWTVADTAIPSGPSAGIYSLAFRDAQHGIAVGGDFTTPTVAPDAVAVTADAGLTWAPATQPLGEYRSGVTFVSPLSMTALAVGPTGSDISTDGGRTWTRFDTGSFDSVACAGAAACWASGAIGRVAVLEP